MEFNSNLESEDLSQYEVRSRREIVALLRAIQERKQLVTMLIDGGPEAIVTSILDVDEASDMVIIDQAPNPAMNQRLVSSSDSSLETSLDNIRILSFASGIKPCLYDGLPALRFAIPGSMIRLQRREHYRVATPVTNPLRCTFELKDAAGKPVGRVALPLHNISGGGIAVIDEKKQLDSTVGRVYKDCKIEMPGASPVVATLEIRSSVDLSLSNGKAVRRLGCMFVGLSAPMLAAVQRYITKLERERNARATGLG